MRIALANLPYPASPEAAVRGVVEAIEGAGAELICFPEGYVPGYRGLGHEPPPPDRAFLEDAWGRITGAAKASRTGVILGTERIAEPGLLMTALVIGPDGERLGFQDKVQLDPSEDGVYTAGEGRRVFRVGGLTFGVAICHEGWRYPETVRYAARHGAQVVFHPHYHPPEPGGHRPVSFAEPANSFHEKAALCRAAENFCWFATVNYACEGSPTTSAFVRPDGTLLSYQPYGEAGLLVADLELPLATRLLAERYKPV